MTVLVVAVAILLDAALAMLSVAHGWTFDMSGEDKIYRLSESGESFMRDAVLSRLEDGGQITLTLCDERKNLTQNTATEYILNTALDIEERFGEHVHVEYLNIYEDPARARELGVDSTTDIAISFGDRHESLSLEQCYVFTDGNTEVPTAYVGERRMLTAMLRAVNKGTKKCYLTLNHGESVSDLELIYLLADSGYICSFIDLFESDIPSDCELLVTISPAQDFSAVEGEGRISEAKKVDNYLKSGGKYMVFVGADTFLSGSLDNFEGLLADWGVNVYHEPGTDGKEYCYTVKDPATSLTPDGYTIFSEQGQSNKAQSILSECKRVGLFGSSALIKPADGFSASADGSYTSSDGKKMYPLLTSTDSAQAWTDGRLVEKARDGKFNLMTLTELECEGGRASLIACASSGFISEEKLQSTVYGNGEIIMRALEYMGAEGIPYELSSKPLYQQPIQSLTGRRAVIITLCLALIPAAAVSAVGAVVLIRRKRA